MDWPSRSLLSRIAWLRIGVSAWLRGRQARAGAEPLWWPEFERAYWLYRDRIGRERQESRGSSTETLYRLAREGRPPLFVIVARDARGHLVNAAACDPDDYR